MEVGYLIGTIIGGLVVCVIFGVITKKINENKGYYGGFWWGFWLGWIGIIVVAVKPDNNSYRNNSNTDYNLSDISNSDKIDDPWSLRRDGESEYQHRLLASGGWKCPTCQRANADYVTTCVCGTPKKRIAENTPK